MLDDQLPRVVRRAATAAMLLAAVACRHPVTPAAGIADPVCWRRSTPMTNGRAYPCATVLKDGRVLVVAGDAAQTSAEVYDPMTSMWALVPSPASSGSGCSGVLLPDGRALFTGGQRGTYPEGFWPIAAAELYDPALNSWASLAPMKLGRSNHRTVVLPGGDVLVVGTLGQDRLPPEEAIGSEIYEVAADRWTPIPFPVAGDVLRGPEAVLTRAGEVVVESSFLRNAFVLSTERTWRIAGEIPGYFGSGLVQLPDGSLMVPGAVGGRDSALGDSLAETWSTGPSFDFVVRNATTLQLPSGDVLVVGGNNDNEAGIEVILANALLFDAKSGEWRSAGRLSFPSDVYRLVMLDENRVLAMPGRFDTEGGQFAVDMLDLRDVSSGCAHGGALR